MIDYERIRQFYQERQPVSAGDGGGIRAGDPDFARGTIETSLPILRFRNRAEALHLAHALPVSRTAEVLDLGGGSGRWAIWFARRCRHVTMVEQAPASLQAAVRNFAHAGLPNHTCLEGSILEPPLPPGRTFDVVHVGAVLVYINDSDLPQVARVIERVTKLGGTFVLREPVDPAGPSMDERAGGYRARFRRPEEYLRLFGDRFRLVYQRTTVSHLVPAGRTTGSFLADLQSSAWQRRALAQALPWLARVDLHLLGLEERLRRSPLRGLLGDPGVVQHFYIFERRT